MNRLTLLTPLLLTLWLPPAQADTRSYMSMDLYGYLEGLVVGDQVSVEDPDGVECGRFIVTSAGRWGLLHVYGDLPGTPEDEGAVEGDTLTFKVNGQRITPEGGAIVWHEGGTSTQVSLPPLLATQVAAADSGGHGGGAPWALLAIGLLTLARRRG